MFDHGTYYDLPWWTSRTKGPFTNICKGGADAKIVIVKIFHPPPSDLKKIKAPLFAKKIMGQPHRKACNSILLENLW